MSHTPTEGSKPLSDPYDFSLLVDIDAHARFLLALLLLIVAELVVQSSLASSPPRISWREPPRPAA